MMDVLAEILLSAYSSELPAHSGVAQLVCRVSRGPQKFRIIRCFFRLPMFLHNPSFNQMQLSMSMIVAGVAFGNFAAVLI